MRRKYKNPPVNEVVIGVYFKDPILAMRAEHVGLFWSTIRRDFPLAQQSIPIGDVDIAVEGEVFPLPRFWFMAEDEVYLLQLQRNAFLLNWRRREEAYPHYEPVKEKFDSLLTIFEKFCADQFGIGSLEIARCELNYINIIEADGAHFRSFADTQDVIPSFRPLSIAPDKPVRGFSIACEYPIASDLSLTVNVQSRKNQKTDDDVLYLELRTAGGLQAQTDNSRNGWFERAHDAIGDAFNALTSPTIQSEQWRFSD